jgi:hypothetical protein
MTRSRNRRGDGLPEEGRTAADRAREIEQRARDILASRPVVDTDDLISRFATAGLPADKVERLKAALDGKSGHYKRQERAEQRLAEIRRLNGEGLHDGAIAGQLGLTRPYVCQVRRANGIPAVRRPR